MPEVAVPHMYTELTTPRVLVMEWIDGDRLRTASQQAPAAAAAAASPVAAAAAGSSRLGLSAAEVANDLRLVEIGVRCSLEQMLEEGFYHAGRCGEGALLITAVSNLNVYSKTSNCNCCFNELCDQTLPPGHLHSK